MNAQWAPWDWFSVRAHAYSDPDGFSCRCWRCGEIKDYSVVVFLCRQLFVSEVSLFDVSVFC